MDGERTKQQRLLDQGLKIPGVTTGFSDAEFESGVFHHRTYLGMFLIPHESYFN